MNNKELDNRRAGALVGLRAGALVGLNPYAECFDSGDTICASDIKTLCVRCKKNKGTIKYADSVLSFTHGFVELICQECYDKIKHENAWYQEGKEEARKELLEDVEKMIKYLQENNLICPEDEKTCAFCLDFYVKYNKIKGKEK